MRLLLLLVGLLSLLTLATVLAQPPVAPPVAAQPAPPIATTPPSTPPATATSGPTGARAVETPLSRFEPLAAFPQQTQNAIRGVLLGAAWLTRMNQPQGRFLYGYNPALRQPLLGDHDLRQAQATLALAQAAQFSGDDQQATMAAQAILTLLTATRIDPADANCRVPVHSSLTCNRVGFAATLALAIYHLPAVDAKLLAEAERLCEFLHKQCREDGSVHYTDGLSDESSKTDPDGLNEYPGLALQAIMVSNRAKPVAWKPEVVKKGMTHYRTVFSTRPHPLLAATLTPACTELYLQTKLADAATVVFELNDWLCSLQIPGNDRRLPQWAGAFRTVVNGQQSDRTPGPETGRFVQSLACACQLTRLTPDLDRHTKYKAAVTDAVQFLCGLQFLEANTRHFENSFRANMLMGGFHLSPADGTLRVDATGIALTGLLRYLESGAEK